MKKILYISGSRADYGLMQETLFGINNSSDLSLEIAVTGMHLMPEFGKTINEIKNDKFKINIINSVYQKDNRESIVNFIGNSILILTKKIKTINPDVILLLGDRAEMLSGAIVGSYLRIPTIHIHGGDISTTIDEITRHSITKLSHIHFAATKKSAKRIIKMGEDPWRVFITGAPGLDSIINKKIICPEEISLKYNINIKKPLLLLIQHPITEEINEASNQMKETLEAIKELEIQVVLIYPNADPGGKKMIKIIEQYRKYSFIKIYKNISRLDYLSLMKLASAIVGNSSSGIIEAPSFHLPTINIGTRQNKRETAKNVINVSYNKQEIKKAILKSINDEKFKNKVKNCQNPYGNGTAKTKIVKILNELNLKDSRLLNKRIYY